MPLIRALGAALLLLAVVSPAPAAALRDSLLVSPSWLGDHLHDADLVLLHVGERPSTTPATSPARGSSSCTTSRLDHTGRADAGDAAAGRAPHAAGGARHLQGLARHRLLRQGLGVAGDAR